MHSFQVGLVSTWCSAELTRRLALWSTVLQSLAAEDPGWEQSCGLLCSHLRVFVVIITSSLYARCLCREREKGFHPKMLSH